MNVYLPSMDSTRLEFMQSVLQGQRAVLLNDQVTQFQVPTQPELAVKMIFTEMREDSELMSYFDIEQATKGRFPERPFFWGIMFTVRKALTKALLQDSIDRRMSIHNERNKNQAPMVMDPTWMQKLLEFPIEHSTGKALKFADCLRF